MTVREARPERTLAELEAVMERGLVTFIEVGTALLEIDDGRLYLESHATFEEYLWERWGASRRADGRTPPPEAPPRGSALPVTGKFNEILEFKVILVLFATITAVAAALFVFQQMKVNNAANAVTVTPKPSSASTPAAHGPGSATHKAPSPKPSSASTPAAHGPGSATHKAPSSVTGRPASVHLEVLADARVWICLQDQRGQLPINGQILPAGAVSQQFVSPAFRIFLGNGSVRLRIDGRVHHIPPSSSPAAYRVSQRGVTVLQAATVEPC